MNTNMTKKIGQVTELRFGTRAKTLNVWMNAQVFCKKYVGKFKQPGLISMAETGLWFVGVSGWPTNGGSGRTPEAAVQDAIDRNEDMIKQLMITNNLLRLALIDPSETPCTK